MTELKLHRGTFRSESSNRDSRTGRFQKTGDLDQSAPAGSEPRDERPASSDGDIEAWRSVGRKVMAEHRNVLKVLAK